MCHSALCFRNSPFWLRFTMSLYYRLDAGAWRNVQSTWNRFQGITDPEATPQGALQSAKSVSETFFDHPIVSFSFLVVAVLIQEIGFVYNRNELLQKHIEFLEGLGIAGVSHHDLLFTKEAEPLPPPGLEEEDLKASWEPRWVLSHFT